MTSTVQALGPAAAAPGSITIPTIGTVGTLSSDTMQSVNPCPQGGCAYAPSGFGPVKTAWSGGGYAYGYGTNGAYFVAGGGDADGFDNSIYLYPLDTGKWKRIAGPSLRAGDAYTGTADFGLGEWDDHTPMMPHTYDSLLYIPGSAAGNRQGAVLIVLNAYGYHQSTSGWTHKCDLDSEKWSLFSTNSYGPGVQESTWGYDTLRSRVLGEITFPGSPSYANLHQMAISAGAGTWSVASSSLPGLGHDGVSDYVASLDAYVQFGYNDSGQSVLRAYDLSGAGINSPYQLATTGDSLPAVAGGAGFCWCPDNNSIYLRDPGIGQEQFLWQVTQPASNWQTAAWKVTKITMQGVSVLGNTPNGMWKALSYAGKIGCVIWNTTVNSPVYAYAVALIVNTRLVPQNSISGIFSRDCKQLDWALLNGRWYKTAGDHVQYDPVSPAIQGGRQEIFSFTVQSDDWTYDQKYFCRATDPTPNSDQVFQMDDGWTVTVGSEIHFFNSVNNPTTDTATATANARNNYGSLDGGGLIATQWSLTQMAWTPPSTPGALNTGKWRVVNPAGTPGIMHGDRSWRGVYDPVLNHIISPCFVNGENWMVVDAATGNDLSPYSAGVPYHYGDNDFHLPGIVADLPNRFIYVVDFTNFTGQTVPSLWRLSLDSIPTNASPGNYGKTKICDIPGAGFESSQTVSRIIWHPKKRCVVCFFASGLFVINVDTLRIDQFSRPDSYMSNDGVHVLHGGSQFYDPVTNDLVSIGGVDFFASPMANPGGYWRIHIV